MKAIFNGKIVLPDHIEDRKALLFDRKIIDIVPTDQIPSDLRPLKSGDIWR